jgi:thymidylate synthase (FAD)
MINGKITSELLPSLSNDVGVVNAAKVSMDKWADTFDSGEHDGSHTRLVRYLAKHRHFTTFTHSRETFIFDVNYIDLHLATEEETTGLVMADYSHYEHEYETLVKFRHSIIGWANLLSKRINNQKLADFINDKLTELYPNVWPILYQHEGERNKAYFDNTIIYVSAKDETNPRFIDVSFRYKTPIPIARQEFKHMVSFTRNEMSRRYVSDNVQIYDVTEWRSKPEGSVKQGSAGINPNQERIDNLYLTACDMALDAYDLMIALEVCPEQARFVLPQGTMVSYVVTGSLTGYKRFLNQRLDSHAQKEIQDLAGQVEMLLENHPNW